MILYLSSDLIVPILYMILYLSSDLREQGYCVVENAAGAAWCDHLRCEMEVLQQRGGLCSSCAPALYRLELKLDEISVRANGGRERGES